MNGKQKKIALGLSGLMCAGMLFSCVLTSEASNGVSKEACPHENWAIIREYDDIMSYDHSVHAFVHVVDKKCSYCNTPQSVITVLYKENHDITEYWDSVENCWAEECGICGYTYHYHY